MSLKIEKSTANGMTVILTGRLDTITAPELEAFFKKELPVPEVVLDFEHLEYISSAGLRVLLMAQKTMSKNGNMKLIHVNAAVQEVLDITGFSGILNIE